MLKRGRPSQAGSTSRPQASPGFSSQGTHITETSALAQSTQTRASGPNELPSHGFLPDKEKTTPAATFPTSLQTQGTLLLFLCKTLFSLVEQSSQM